MDKAKVGSLRPMIGKMVVKKIDESNVTKSGVILIKSDEQQQWKAQVVSVGDAPKNCEQEVFPGDIIVCGKFAGIPIQVEEEGEYFILSQLEALIKLVE